VSVRRTALLAIVLVAAMALVGCGSSSGPSASRTSTSTAAAADITGSVTVSAAASLTEAFGRIGADFHRAHPGATVTFNFGSSGTLATQIQQGAPVDAFASADPALITPLQVAHLVAGRATVIANNRLEIVTKPGNPQKIRRLRDLATVGVVSLCGDTVPCGKYATQILDQARVAIPTEKITRGQDVKATLAAVTTGDADAAIVYVTDAETAGRAVTAVPIPEAQNAIATYPMVVLKRAANAATARAFVAYVASAKGQATLRSFGFLPK
jgi:molybdate transport system substrate-binding protein